MEIDWKFDCEVTRITDKAVRVIYENEEIWLPLSQISPSDGFGVGDTISFTIPEWIAKEKGMM